jgi:hypothetical protein
LCAHAPRWERGRGSLCKGLDGRRAIVEIEVTESAEPQELMLINPLSGDDGRLLEMKGKGSARLDLDLGGLPLSFGHGAIEDHTTMRFTSRSEETKEITKTTRLEVDVAR